MTNNEEDGRYIPFNLSSVAPFESTAAALAALPLMRPPEPPTIFTEPSPLSISGGNPAPDVAARALRLLRDTATTGTSWSIDPAEIFLSQHVTTNCPWVGGAAAVLRDMIANSNASALAARRDEDLDAVSARRPQTSTPRRRRSAPQPQPQPQLQPQLQPQPQPQPQSQPERPSRRTSLLSRNSPRAMPSNGAHIVTREEDDESQFEEEDIDDSESEPAWTSPVDEQEELQREAAAAEAGNDFDEAEFEGFVNCLRKLVAPNGRPPKTEDDALSVTRNKRVLSDMRQSISLHARAGLLRHIDPILLRSYMSALGVRVRESTQICNARTFKGCALTEAVLGAEAALTSLTIFGAPGTPRTLLVEETLDESVAFLRALATNILYPAVDPIFAENRHSNRSKKTVVENEDYSRDNLATPSHVNSSNKRLIPNLLLSVATLMDLVASLALKGHLGEPVAIQSATFAVRSLRVTSVGPVHAAAVSVVAAVYAAHPQFSGQLLHELVTEAAQVPPVRKHLRSYRVVAPGLNSIRAISAAALHIVQAPHGSLSKKSSITLIHTSRIEAASKFALHFANEILSRAFKERDAEFRTAAQALIDDFLALYCVPDWPGAELILQSFSVQIVRRLESKENLSAYARALAIDYLSALAAKMTELFGGALLDNTELRSESDTKVERSRLVLLRFFDDENSHDEACDFGARSLWEALFADDDFQTLRREHTQPGKESAHSNQQVNGDAFADEEVLDGSDASSSKKPFSEAEVLEKVEVLLKARKKALELYSRSDELATRQDAAEATRCIASRRGLCLNFSAVLDAILFCLQDQSPTVRAKAVRALSHMRFDNTTIIKFLPTLLSVMENSCRDISTLVRDAALDFLGRFLTLHTESKAADLNSIVKSDISPEFSRLTGAEVFTKVFDLVDKRLKDSAVSVRKRAINIFRNLASEISSKRKSPQRTQGFVDVKSYNDRLEELVVRVCSSLVGRLDDPESTVREASESTVLYCLFGISPEDKFSFDNSEEQTILHTRRLISVFLKLPWAAHMSFLTRIIRKPVLKNYRNLLESITKSTVEHLHDFEEQIASGDVEDDESSSNVISHAQATYDCRRVACASILCGLCLVSPSLMAPHCAALSPCLKGFVERSATEGDIRCIQRILYLLESGIPHVGDVEPRFLEELIGDVEIIVCQYPSPVLEEASVRCMCALAIFSNTSQSRDLLINTASTFLNFLNGHLSAFEALANPSVPNPSTGVERNARGALLRLGLLVRYGNFCSEFVSDVYEALRKVCSIMLKGWPDGETSLFTPASLVKGSVRSLIHFLIRHRSFLPRGTHIILEFANRSLHSLTSPNQQPEHAREILLTILYGFHEMLRNEEERNSSPQNGKSLEKRGVKVEGKVGDEYEEKSKRPSLGAEEDAEAGYLAVCAQSLIATLSEAATCQQLAVRRCVANILGILTRQGLVLPATIISPLFCLLTDVDSRCRDDSFRVVAFIADRHSSMLASAALPAIHHSFQHAICRLRKPVADCALVNLISEAVVDPKTGFSFLSPAFVLLNRDHRQGILEGLLREFDPCVTTRAGSSFPIVKHSDDQTEDVLDSSSPGEARDAQLSTGGEDDVAISGTGEIQLHGTKKLCSLSKLTFIAITLARLDYSNGVGLGGSLKHGGGTAAADAKLKAGRDDISYICAIATRIISNSGQAVLRVAAQKMKASFFDPGLKRLIADHAIRLSVLLHLKHYLRGLRNLTSSLPNDQEPDAETDGQRTAPTFSLENLSLTTGPLFHEDVFPPASEFENDNQLKVFRKLMHDDAIDESDVSKSSRYQRTGFSSYSARRVKARRALPSAKRGKIIKRRKSEVHARKRLRFGDEDSDGGSDYAL